MNLSPDSNCSSYPAGPEIQDLAAQKSALRKLVRGRLSQIHPEERARLSQSAHDLLLGRTEWLQAKTVVLYAPLPDEIDLWPLLPLALQSGKKVCLPQYQPASRIYEIRQVCDLARDIVTGFFGIREPSPACPAPHLKSLDLVLVPGVAFARDGCRLGRGKGYYDRLLKNINGRKCGVAFDPQVLQSIPASPTDIPCDCILTPTRWIIAGPGAV